MARTRRMVGVGLGVLALAAAAFVVIESAPFDSRSGGAETGGTGRTSTAAVARRTLSSRTSVGGSLGYAGDYAVLGHGGTVTWLPGAGQIIRHGRPLYRVDDKPVLLLYGRTPMYRALAEGATAASVTGRDVRELNRELVRLGFAKGLDLDPSSDEFSWATKVAVERMQKRWGIAQTGSLAVGDVVFLPGAVRVSSVAGSVGAPGGGQLLKLTSTRRVVTVHLDAGQQATVKPGDRAAITLPDGRTVPGRVTSVGKVATAGSGSDSTPTVTASVTPDRLAAGTLDQAPVQVVITTGTVPDVLVVPVTALLALSGGGYAVQVVAGAGRYRLVPVSLGLFDDSDGLVQVTAAQLHPGQRVVVPAS